jgi:hypothetical protein
LSTTGAQPAPKATTTTMPISELQLAANRANAQLSHGPNTPNGKKKSSMNALRHGVTAQTTIMTEEDRIKHDEFCRNMVADFAPVGTMEIFLASSVAEEAWRLNHARAECNNVVAIGHFDGTGDAYETEHPEIHTAVTSAQVTRDHAKDLELLSLYEQRIHRSFEKYFAQLRQLQAERKAVHDTDLDNARLLSQLAVLQDLPFHPASDGIVFSNDEIDRYTERFHRSNLAKLRNSAYMDHIKIFKMPSVHALPKQAA